MITYNCFVSGNYEQLQQWCISVFLMSGRESHPRQKNLRNSKLGRGVPYIGWNRDKTNIQTKNFIRNNICDNEKYIPTTKYVSITPPQKVQEKYFGALIFETCPPVSQDTVQYSRYSLTHCCNALHIRCFCGSLALNLFNDS